MQEIDKKTQYNLAYAKKKLKRIPLDVQKEKYDEIQSAANAVGESVNGYIKRAIDERMERDNQSSGGLQKETPSEPDAHKEKRSTPPTAPDHGHIDVKTEPAAPVHESPVEKLERLRRKTMDSMANQHSKAGNGHIPMQKGEPDTQRRKPEYGSGANSHITIGGWTDMPDAHRETFEEKMERLRKSHPLKMDGVVQRQ